MKTSIILTGLSGSGKTSVGQALSELLKWQLLDTDSLIESRFKEPVTTIFATRGELFFRDAETEILNGLLNGSISDFLPPAVISTGGGIIIREENRRMLCWVCLVVCLSTPISLLSSRLSTDNTRPLLSHTSEENTGQDDKVNTVKEIAASPLAVKLADLWEKRKSAYLEADLTVETGNLSPLEVAKTISSLLEIPPTVCKIQSEC